MTLNEKLEKLKEFQIYKEMINNGEIQGKNTIIESKDEETIVIKQPELAIDVDKIERITILIGEEEFEFVACQ